MFIRHIFFAVFALLVSGAPALALNLEIIDLPRFWQGGAVRDDASGEFTHCMGIASYDETTSLTIQQDIFGNWLMFVLKRDWNNEAGTETDLRYRFNDGIWITGRAHPILPQLLMLLTTDGSEFLKNFQNKRTLEVELDGIRESFPLPGTNKLVEALRQCVKERTPDDFHPDSLAVEDAREFGTGIIITQDGLILTNLHVAGRCNAIHIVRKGLETLGAELVAADEENDLALLQASGKFAEGDVGVFRMGTTLKFGEPISVFGFPLAGALSTSGNYVLGNVTALSGLSDDVRFLQISAPIQPGNSGGPLFDQYGLVVGLVSSRIDDFSVIRATGAVPQNVNFALKRRPIFKFLYKNDVDYALAFPDKVLGTTEVADKAVAASVEIACNIVDPYAALGRLP